MSRETHLHISARLRSLENQILDKTDIERMIEAKDAPEVFSVLNNTDYADNLLGVKVENYPQAFNKDLEQVKKLFSKNLPVKALLIWIFLEYDFHNLKLLFKTKYGGQDLKKHLFSFGNEPISDLSQYILQPKEIEKKSLLNLSKEIKEIIEKASKVFEKNPQPFYIDAFLDREYFKFLSDIAQELKSEFISNIVKKQIDIANLRIFLRALSLKKPKEFITELLISKGEIPEKTFLKFYGEDINNALKHFSRHLPRSVEKILSVYLKNKDFQELEKGLEDFQTELFKESKYIAYGPEVVLAYCWAKKIAIKNIQLIMNGKLNNLPKEEILQRIRKPWR